MLLECARASRSRRPPASCTLVPNGVQEARFSTSTRPMRDILSTPNAAVLSRYIGSQTILVFGFDGVLAPLVAERRSAALRQSTRRGLVQVANRYRSVVVSGRTRSDLLGRLEGPRLRHVVGNHGLEPLRGDERWARELALVRPSLVARLERLQGVEIEDKRFSLSIHYRRSRTKTATLGLILEALEDLEPSVAIGLGELAVEVTPRDAPTRGDAVRAIAAVERASSVIHVGAERGDEDVFSLRNPEVLGIRVGVQLGTHADWYLREQRSIDDFLAMLLRLRGPASS